MARLKAAPLIRYHSPTYPTRIEVMADRQLLARHVPPAWLSHRELAGAFGALLLAAQTGCTDRPAPAGTPPASAPTRLGKAAVVAPIFRHGSSGGPRWHRMYVLGIPASTPAFLTEEEAIQIIKEELMSNGLTMSKRDVTFDSVSSQGRRLQPGYEWASGWNGETLVDAPGPLVMDLVDPTHKVAIEYVAETDFYPLGGDDEPSGTVSMKDVAASLAERVSRNAEDIYFGTFYDPVTHFELCPPLTTLATNSSATTQPTTAAEALTESKRLLRLQVRDFVDWLKAQGVI